MDAKKALATALIATSILALSYSRAWAWQTNINGTANSADWASAVVVDGAGNVAVAGRTENTNTGYDFTVIKFDGLSGVELWRQVINGTANGYDEANAVAVDAMGNVVAAGSTENAGTGNNFTLIKFDGVTGTELWRRVFVDFYGTAIAVDAAGNPVASGHPPSCTNPCVYDFTVIKFDRLTGVELWRQVINGTANGNAVAYTVAVDAAGNVVAAGFTLNTGTLTDFTVIKFDGVNGIELWRKEINGTANGYDSAEAVAVDAAGNVVAAGSMNRICVGSECEFSYLPPDFAVVKLDGTTGQELWRQLINGTGPNSYDFASAVIFDQAGNVLATGVTDYRCDEFMCPYTPNVVIKFDGASGAELWRRGLYGSQIAVGAGGNVFAAGAGFDVVKFDSVTGNLLWYETIKGTVNDFNFAYAVAVDAAGNAVAAGYTHNVGSGPDFTVVKLIEAAIPPVPPPPPPPSPPVPLSIGATMLAAGEAGVPFSSNLMISGGVAPYGVSITSGKLPAGLSLGNDGIISGTLSPTARTQKATIRVTDSVNESVSQTFTITVLKALRIAGKLKTGRVGNNYSDSLKTRGGLGPFNWNITAGAVPGLSFNNTTGALTGIPTQAGEFPLTVQVTDALGGTAVENLTLRIR